MKKLLTIFLLLAVAAAALGGCAAGNSDSESFAAATVDEATADSATADEATADEATPDEPIPTYMIDNVQPILQSELKAGCETYAATMLLRSLGFNVTEYILADNYLNMHYISYAADGSKYGPDMNSAFAGSAYAGWGVYAPSMAKSMNSYLTDQKSKLTAYAFKGISLEELISDYIVNGVPVMIWATTDMEEPYVFDTWTVDYVDENAETKIGDTVSWYMHEHCLVLIGYDEEEYFFADSTHGNISHFDKALVAQRYAEMGSQCIIVQ